jgi:uncharacterized protein
MSTRNPAFLPAEFTALHVDAWTAPFWEATTRHELIAPKCTKCGEFRMPPAPFCWNCRAQDVEWVTLPGTGSIFTYTVTHQPLLPSLADVVPYITVVVDMDGAAGVRLVSQLVNADPSTLAIGQRVDVVWDDIREGTTVPRFAPAL